MLQLPHVLSGVEGRGGEGRGGEGREGGREKEEGRERRINITCI